MKFDIKIQFVESDSTKGLLRRLLVALERIATAVEKAAPDDREPDKMIVDVGDPQPEGN